MGKGRIEQVLRERHDGWTLARQVAFIDTLAETANVAAACRSVGQSTTTAYRLRQRSASFARAWESALARGTLDLERVAMERALDGVERPLFRNGKRVGKMRRYSDALLM